MPPSGVRCFSTVSTTTATNSTGNAMTSHDPPREGARTGVPADLDTEADAQQPSASSQRDMSPDEALERIRAGRTLSNARVVGLVFQGEFDQAIKVENVTLVRPRFSGATFRDVVGIYRSTLIRPFVGQKTVFESVLNLGGSTLRRPTFKNFTLRGTLRCDNCRFVGRLRMQNARFEQGVRFWNARFDGWVEFQDCRFDTQADFRSFHADEGVSFERCHFTDDFLLRGATVSKKLDFATSRFEALVDLSKAKLHDYVYLERIEQGDAQRFAVANAIADRVLVAPGQLGGRLASEQQRDYATAMQEFGLLRRNFETLNRYDDEDWAFYRFKINERRSRSQSWFRPWTKLIRACDLVFLDWGCGYGTDPFRAVRTAVVMIVLFALVYLCGIHYFDIETPPLASQPADSLVNRSLFGLMTSISVFTAGFTGEHLNTAHGWMLLPLGIEALLGTLLWGLFIVAFSRKVIR